MGISVFNISNLDNRIDMCGYSGNDSWQTGATLGDYMTLSVLVTDILGIPFLFYCGDIVIHFDSR